MLGCDGAHIMQKLFINATERIPQRPHEFLFRVGNLAQSCTHLLDELNYIGHAGLRALVQFGSNHSFTKKFWRFRGPNKGSRHLEPVIVCARERVRFRTPNQLDCTHALKWRVNVHFIEFPRSERRRRAWPFDRGFWLAIPHQSPSLDPVVPLGKDCERFDDLLPCVLKIVLDRSHPIQSCRRRAPSPSCPPTVGSNGHPRACHRNTCLTSQKPMSEP